MKNVFLSRPMENGCVLNLSPLSNRRLAAAGRCISDSAGYFLYEAKPCDPESVKIIARVENDDAVWELQTLLGLE